jgi:uncharacterized protein YndB with AHSA1/START domain
MRVLGRLVVAVVLLAAVLAGIGFLLPREVVVTRSVTVDAPPAAVYPLVASLRRFVEWSPWQAMDPGMTQTFEGPEAGVGARMTWASENPQVGAGTQEIVAVEPDARVDYRLSFDGMAESAASFVLRPEAAGTRVDWQMRADMGMNPVGRWFGLMMDRWVGADFERGLAALKSRAEGG